jgi:hypothetical protein
VSELRGPYQVTRAESDPARSREIICLTCGGPLDAREGKFALNISFCDRAASLTTAESVAEARAQGRQRDGRGVAAVVAPELARCVSVGADILRTRRLLLYERHAVNH